MDVDEIALEKVEGWKERPREGNSDVVDKSITIVYYLFNILYIIRVVTQRPHIFPTMWAGLRVAPQGWTLRHPLTAFKTHGWNARVQDSIEQHLPRPPLRSVPSRPTRERLLPTARNSIWRFQTLCTRRSRAASVL